MGSSDRVKEFLDYKGISKYKFCKDLGFSNKFLDNSSNMGTDKARKILHHFPKLNPEWLITGNGSMLKREMGITPMDQSRKTRDAVLESQDVPLYDIQAVAGLKELFDSDQPAEILDTIRIPNLPRCDGAITITGDSMYPLLKSGDMVLYAETQIDSIFFGEMYLLGIRLNDFEEFVTVKYIHRSERENHIVLVSQNKHHDNKEIPLNSIRSIALVKASIRINTML